MNTFTSTIRAACAVTFAALALSGCGYSSYLKATDSANAARVEIVKQEQKAKVADAGADEAGFKALQEATRSDNPVVAGIASAQLGTVLAVRAVSAKHSGGSAASAVQNPEKPTDPAELALRGLAIATGGFVQVRNSDNSRITNVAQIEGETLRSLSRDQSTTAIARGNVDIVTALHDPLSRVTSTTTITADNGALVNVSGTQSQTVTRTDTQNVNCATGPAGSSGAAGNGSSTPASGTGATSQPGSTAPGGASGSGGQAGSNGCNASRP